MAVTRVDNVLIMELRDSTKCIFQNTFRHCEGQVFLNEAEEMIGEVLENEHGLFRDDVLDKADIVGATAQFIVDVLKVMEIDFGNILQYELLVASTEEVTRKVM